MDPTLLLLLLGGGGSALAGLAVWQRRTGLKHWKDAARTLGLAYSGRQLPTLSGRIGELEVFADVPVGVGPTSGSVQISVRGPGLPSSVVLELVRPRLGLEQLEPPGTGPLKSTGGGLFQFVGPLDQASPALTSHVERLVRAARYLAGSRIPELLAENVAGSGPAGVRLESLRALAEHYLDDEVTARALHACLSESDRELRLLAALETCPSALVAFATDPSIDPGLRWRAQIKLETSLPYEQLSPVLAKVLALPGDETRSRALSLIAAHKDTAHLEAVRSLVPGANESVAEGVANALTQLGCRDEATWIALLATPSTRAALEATQVLRASGSVRAVEPLLALAERGELRDVAREAVRTIQSRLSGAEAGGVSLVQSVDGGAVSVVPDAGKR
ncbi:MAG: hypothetical protein QM765_31945 [Myxococcales bacterium]